MTGFSKRDHYTIMHRNNGLCEVCGDRRATQAHHRKPRGMGGVTGSRSEEVNRPSNGLALCNDCHYFVESERDIALSSGWLVHRTDDPATVPALLSVWLGDGMLITLGDDGTYDPE